MLHVHLPANTEHFTLVHALHVFERCSLAASTAQIFVKHIKEPLHMVRDLTAQPLAHFLTDFLGKIEAIGLRQRA